MRHEIEKSKMPDWLDGNEFSFHVANILKESLYYPSCGLDGDPVKYFAGNVFSFIYVDYGISREIFLNEINERGFRGYRIIHRQSILQNELIPNGWTVYIPAEIWERNPSEQIHRNGIIEPFFEWVIFEREENKDDSHNPKRFSLLYVYADGVAAYQALYLSNNAKPKIIAIIQSGHKFGTNWTDFTDRNKIFAESVFYNENLLPEYIVNGGWRKKDSYHKPIWREFNKEMCLLHKSPKGVLMLWGRGDNTE
jgi:hypothetical protein